MLITIPGLLTAERLVEADRLLAEAAFIDGNATAGPDAEAVKNNLQIDRDNTPNIQELDQLILGALMSHITVRAATLPAKVRPPLYNRYGVDMGYGPHMDNPVLQGNPPVRTDISVTVFLSAQEDYDGGELVIGTDAGEVKVKLPRGDAVLYSSQSLHKIETITRGERNAAVTWIQSMVADPHQRQILYELDVATQMVAQDSPGTQQLRFLTKTYGNLVRLWAEV